MEKSVYCQQQSVPHGAKVFVAAFLLASYLVPRRPERECKPSVKKVPNDSNLMEHSWPLAPYKYNRTAPARSSFDLLMIQSRQQYDKANPPPEPEPEFDHQIHYDYKKIYKRIKL